MTQMKLQDSLNGICPYFTMFPLSFPYSLLSRHALGGDWVLDPFCGRGTTNYASRMLGLPSVGIDSSPVAVAISQAKLANTSPELIVQAAKSVLDEVKCPSDLPEGEFWEWAFHPDVLKIICRLREGLLKDSHSESRKALRAILLGALHGPRPKSYPAYFSNQSQRTYAPKPKYAVNFWKSRNLTPELVDVLGIIKTRADRYYAQETTKAVGKIIQGDSRQKNLYSQVATEKKFGWVITSPPYYGMYTYLPDQWLRLWFVGGPPRVEYSRSEQLQHSSPDSFASQLREVWQNVGSVCKTEANLVIRFGGINDRKAEPLPILEQSLKDSGWKVRAIEPAGSASTGRRQALHISDSIKNAREEYDIWAVREG